MFKPMRWVAALIAAITLSAPAIADVSISTSNNPTIALNQRLGSLFGAETNILTSFSVRDLSRLNPIMARSTTAPENNRKAVKAQGSIAFSARAIRQSTEFAANARRAREVKRIVFVRISG